MTLDIEKNPYQIGKHQPNAIVQRRSPSQRLRIAYEDMQSRELLYRILLGFVAVVTVMATVRFIF